MGDYDEDTANPCSTGNTVSAFGLLGDHISIFFVQYKS